MLDLYNDKLEEYREDFYTYTVRGKKIQVKNFYKSLSGLNRSKKLLEHLKEISIVNFDYSDVVRHPLVSKIVKAYSDQNND